MPAPKGSVSKAPTGPFQTTVAAFCNRPAYSSTVLGPTSRIISSAGTLSTSQTVAVWPGASSLAVTTSTGRGRVLPSSLALAMTFLASSTSSGSYREVPTL